MTAFKFKCIGGKKTFLTVPQQVSSDFMPSCASLSYCTKRHIVHVESPSTEDQNSISVILA